MGGLSVTGARVTGGHARDRRLWNASILALLFSTIFFRASDTVADPDLWGNLKFGEDVWRAGGPPARDPYSYLTAGQPWINHEWLAELLSFAAYRAGGAPALIALKVALALAIVALGYAHLRRRGLDVLGAALAAAYSMVLVLPGLRSLRPQAFTYLLFLITLLLIDRAERRRPGGGRGLWLLAPLFALWANLHGGVLAGIGIVAVWCGAHLAARRMESRRTRDLAASARAIIPPVVTAALATLLTPYGVRLWVFFRTAFQPRPEIAEWVPVHLPTLEGVVYLIALGVSIAALVWSRRDKVAPLIAVFAGAALLPLAARRHLPLFALAALVVAGEHIADAAALWMGRRWPSATRSRGDSRRRLLAGLAGAEALLLLVLSAPHFRAIRVEPGRHPAGAVALLERAGVHGNMAVFFDWGHYALWHLGPRIKVSIDGRRETVYPADVYWENEAFTEGLYHWDRLLERHTDLALVSKDYPVFNLLGLEPGWTLAYEDEISALFVREASPASEPLRRARAAGVRVEPRPVFP